jgi:hypothetical protein
MRITLAILALSFICFAFYPQPTAQAAARYDAQCKAAGGTSLVWDGIGLRWCCTRRTAHARYKLRSGAKADQAAIRKGPARGAGPFLPSRVRS